MPVTYSTENIYFDKATRRYRIKTGTGKGTFVSRQVFIDIHERFIQKKSDELASLAETFFNNPSKANLEKAAGILKQIHISNGIVAAGGVDNMYNLFANDYLAIGRTLRSHYGLSENKEQPFGLVFLFQQLKDGEVVSPKLLEHRLRMFAASGSQSGDAVTKNKEIIKGRSLARRILGATDNHCVSCLFYSNQGWIPISEVILPGQKCECHTNCKCSIEYK